MSDYAIEPDTIVEFWREAGPDKWFNADPDFDETIRGRFLDIYEFAARGELDRWMDEPSGALALIIILDQFPRNMFRGTPRAFATDDKALAIARKALDRGDHETVAEDINQFLAMPLMHSEDLADQDASVEWMERLGDEENVKAAQEHRDIVARYSRFPHRNAVLGRNAQPEEEAYLAEGGFAG